MSRAQATDPASSAIYTAASTADACRQIWDLFELWHDAPKEISQLRDELAQANEFFSMVQLAVTKCAWVRTADWVGQLTSELEDCFNKAETVVREIQTYLHNLLDVSSTYEVDTSNKKRRTLWLRSHDEINRLRSHLKDAMFGICSVLAILDSPGSLGFKPSPPVLERLVEAEGGNFTTPNLLITDISQLQSQPEEAHAMNEVILFNSNKEGSHPESVSEDLALQDSNPERHKSRWAEHKRLGSRGLAFPSSYTRSLCPNDCICACHSVKNSGRWAMQSPLLGSLWIWYRGIARRRIPCSNPQCMSSQSQEKFIRVDVQPPTWLLRATISAFLSFGLPSPELLLRVNKITEVTDVHSFINQLLWAIQREESAHVKHFLQSRLVRADDLYGDPIVGFTPLRLALDRKARDVARLLYHSGGFHNTLQGTAASSLLLWLEQDPTAADFLAAHFPLAAVVEEADYTTLHKIIMGLRHLDLHEFLRTPEGLAAVNQPNAFGRTPLHVAALRGDAAAVMALLDAGAALDARGNHAKHALHYACKAGSIAAVDALLARGASLQVRDSVGRTALFDLVGYGSNTNPNLVTHLLALGIVQDPAEWVTATLLALSNKRIAAVERLLPYWPRAHQLPLYPAVHIGSTDGVRLLLAQGADYRTIDAFGEGILHWLAGSGLAMLRLFKGMGVTGVDPGMRDNRGKTAVDIMEGRWDLTDEFRREFMELLEGVGAGEVAEVEESDEGEGEGQGLGMIEDGDLSDDEFFDAVDNFCTSTTAVPEDDHTRPAAVEEAASPLEPDRAQSPDSLVSGVETLSLSAAEQESLDQSAIRNEDDILHCEPETADSSDGDRISSGQGQGLLNGGTEVERWTAEEASSGSDTEQKYIRSPRERELGAEKVFTDEAGLKFLGTSAALRGQ